MQLVLFAVTNANAFEKQADALTTFLHSCQEISQPATRPTVSEGTLENTGSNAAILRGLWVNAGPNTRSRDGSHTGAVHVKDVAVDIANRTIYVAAIAVADFSPSGGIFASSDGGATWQRLYGQDCTQIVLTGGRRLYALEDHGARIVRSDDHDKTWTCCPTPRYRWFGVVENRKRVIGSSKAVCGSTVSFPSKQKCQRGCIVFVCFRRPDDTDMFLSNGRNGWISRQRRRSTTSICSPTAGLKRAVRKWSSESRTRPMSGVKPSAFSAAPA